jgi:hypothetical protein
MQDLQSRNKNIVAYFYFDFENTAIIVSDKRACVGLQERGGEVTGEAVLA